MSRFDRTPDIPVPIGPCGCPGTPHGDGDVVYLAAVLSAPGGMAAQGAISDADGSGIKLQELLWQVYRDHGITSWNFVDEDGDPVPLTADNIELALPYGKGGQTVADKADALYHEDVLRPFMERLAELQKIADQATPRGKRSRAGSAPTPSSGTSAEPTSMTSRPRRSSTPGTEADPPAA